MTATKKKAARPPILLNSYAFRDYPLEVTCEKAAQYGYDGVELSTVHYQDEPLDSVGERIVGLTQRCGVPVTAVFFGVDLLERDNERWERNIDRLLQGINAFAKLKITLLNASVAPLRNPESDERSGSWLAQDWHYERVSSALRRLVPALEKCKSLLNLEIHMHSLHDRARSTRELLRAVASPRVKANLDPGSLFATPGAESAARAVELLNDDIGYLHLKNVRRVGNHFDFSHLLEEGNLDYYAILSAVRQHGLNVPMCIDYSGAGDVRRAARRDLEYLCSLLDQLDSQCG